MTVGIRNAYQAPQPPYMQKEPLFAPHEHKPWIEGTCSHNGGPVVQGSSGQDYCAICLKVKAKKPPDKKTWLKAPPNR